MCHLWPNASKAKKSLLIAIQENADVKLLRAVQVNIIGAEECKEIYAWKYDLTPRMVCAGVPEGEKDICSGDNGGALVLKKSGKQVGVVSYGLGPCQDKDNPGVYANVADKEIHDFIYNQLQELSFVASPNGSEV